VEDELVVVLCEMITIDGREGSEDCDVTIEVLGLDVVIDDDTCEVMLELLEMTELLEVLVLDVGLMVAVGTGVMKQQWWKLDCCLEWRMWIETN
jgi:hypothetical protein